MFYLTIVKKTRRHSHSWLAGQYNVHYYVCFCGKIITHLITTSRFIVKYFDCKLSKFLHNPTPLGGSQTQELDVDNFLYLYTLYVVKGRTVTPLLHKLFLCELHRYYSGNNLVHIPFELSIACSILRSISEICHIHGFIVILFSVKSDFSRVMGARPSLLFCVQVSQQM